MAPSSLVLSAMPAGRCRRCRRCRRRRRRRCRRRRRSSSWLDSSKGGLNGLKTSIGTIVAWGTNWAITPATGVPCPALELCEDGIVRSSAGATAAHRRRRHRRRRRRPPGRGVPSCWHGGQVLVARAARDDVGTRGDPTAE